VKLSFLSKRWRLSKKKGFWVLAGIAVFVLIVTAGVLPLMDETKKMEEEISVKKMTLERYSKFLQTRKAIEEELDRTRKQYESLQQKLLPGETPQLAAANLQEMVKKAIERNGMAIRSFRMLEPKEGQAYQRISIHIDFNPVNNMLSLIQFIHDIEHHEKDLMISEMDLLVPNPRMPNQIQGSFVITGAIKKGETKVKGKEG
jgi:Tfp pilus assembly protein PilO